MEHRENARIGPIAADRISQVLTTVLSAREIVAYYELLYRGSESSMTFCEFDHQRNEPNDSLSQHKFIFRACALKREKQKRPYNKVSPLHSPLLLTGLSLSFLFVAPGVRLSM